MSEEEKKIRPPIRRVESDAEAPATPRAPVRDDPRDAAAKRAAELRNHRSGHVTDDEFDVSNLAPPGWTYQWMTWSIYEQRQVTNMMNVEARGWQPVPRSQHPEMMPRDSDSDVILRKGCILMQLPTEIVEEYRQADIKEARDLIRSKEQQLAGTPEGHLPRGETPGSRPRIGKTFEAMPIPDK